MRSTRAKGNEVELRIQRWLEDAGWLVHRARQSNSRKPTGKERCGGCGGPMKTQWVSLSNDVFGCFDLLARRRGVEWDLQITTGGGAAQKRKDVEEHISQLKGDGKLPVDYFVIVWDGVSKAAKGKYTVFKYTEELAEGAPSWWYAHLKPYEVQELFALPKVDDAFDKWMIVSKFTPKPKLPSLFDELGAP